jgi:hypothetical protein
VRNRIEEIYNRVNDATYGLAELLVVGGAGSVMAIGLYCICAGIIWCLLKVIDIFF